LNHEATKNTKNNQLHLHVLRGFVVNFCFGFRHSDFVIRISDFPFGILRIDVVPLENIAGSTQLGGRRGDGDAGVTVDP
jgi:hypothetical protein